MALSLCCLFLLGCTGKRGEMDRMMKLRADLLGCESISFQADITADYGDALQQFSMDCQGDNDGNVSFTVTAPETLAGITGRIEAGKGQLTFDDVALEFPMLADDQIAPVTGPWILMKTLLGGYLTACGQEEELLHLTINDSYEADALQVDLWLDEEDRPVNAEVCYDGRRILTMVVGSFQIR